MELFCSVGYEKTTVVDIVQKAGVAKGTFFYYFPTKEAILETIVNRWASELAIAFQLKSRQFSALDKLQLFIEQLFQPSQMDALCSSLFAESQIMFLHKLWQQQIESVFNPLLADVLEQGNQEKTMHVAFINETLTFFWSTLNCLWEADYFKDPSAVVKIKVKIATSILERIFGIEAATLKISIL